MGRIEEAVRKLQKIGNTRPQSQGRTAEADTEPLRLGTITTQTIEDAGRSVQVDLQLLRENELLAPDSDERRLAEQYRTIKRPILRNADAARDPQIDHGNLLMVASSLSGEGKTFSCINLCLSMAREKDWAVVLVDADCSKPHLSRLFSVEEEPGLLDLLRDPERDFESVIIPTDIPSLSLVPAGTQGNDASELLASNRMSRLCASLSSSHPNWMFVFDSSPLLLTTEAVALAAHVGQIAFVVRANETPQTAVLAALEKLDPEKAIGCILNQTYGMGFMQSDDYGYGAYGAYGAYGS